MEQKWLEDFVDGVRFVQVETIKEFELHNYKFTFVVDDYRLYNRPKELTVTAESLKDANHMFSEWCLKKHIVANVMDAIEVINDD